MFAGIEVAITEELLTLSSVNFSYVVGGPLALEGVSLSLNASQSVALVGGSGSGKSTLMKVLMTWLSPTAGSYNCSGQPATVGSLRCKMAVVHQEVLLLEGTIHDNIAFGSSR